MTAAPRDLQKAPSYATEYRQVLRGLFDAVEVSAPTESATFERGIQLTAGMFRTASQAGGKIMLIGNGASAAIAGHQAADLVRGVGMAACTFNDAPLLTCLGNDLGYEHTFDTPIGLHAKPGDVLVCISSSGASKNVLFGAQMARSKGCKVLTLSGFKTDNPLRALGDVNFFVPSNGYGFVEVVHLGILHCAIDFLAGR